MRRLLGLAFVAVGLAVGGGCCHTCDVCDDCGGCVGDYGVYSQPACSTCPGYAVRGGKSSKPIKTTTVATPTRSATTTR